MYYFFLSVKKSQRIRSKSLDNSGYITRLCAGKKATPASNAAELAGRARLLEIVCLLSLFFTNYPGYLKDMFTVRSSSYNLRGNHILALPNPKPRTYGLHSFSYLASKIWNSLPDTYKTLNLPEFKQENLRYEAFPQ